MTCALFDAFQFDSDAIMPMRMAPPATALYSNVEKDLKREREREEHKNRRTHITRIMLTNSVMPFHNC